MALMERASTEQIMIERKVKCGRKGGNVDNGYESEADVVLRRLGVKSSMAWAWDELDRSVETCLGGLNRTVVTFHPHWSNGTAGARASEPVVNYGFNYWEIQVGGRVFGTSLMFGVSTKQARLHTNDFKHLLGEDEHGWGMSHNGRLYHNGVFTNYCPPFKEYVPVTVGVLLDMNRGELTYFKNGKSLGVAFTGLLDVHADLYPTVCSTAAITTMSIGRGLKSFADLMDRCRHVITSAILPVSCESNEKFVENIKTLPVPNAIKKYLCNV